VRLANEYMLGALRLISIKQGHDPRDFALCAFGGAGLLHANALGLLMNAWPVIIPPGPGVLCAWGDATTRIKDEAARSLLRRVSDLSPDDVRQMLLELGEVVRASLARQGIVHDQQQLSWQADVRYQGQALLLTLEIDLERLGNEGLGIITAAFDAEHAQLFSFSHGQAHELVNLRAIARAPRPQIREPDFAAAGESPADARVGETGIHHRGRSHHAALYARDRLGPGQCIPGPAIVMEMDSTTLILPGCRAEVDRIGAATTRESATGCWPMVIFPSTMTAG